MNQRQLHILKEHHKRYITQKNAPKQPCIDQCIANAVMKGLPLRMKSAKHIAETLAEKRLGSDYSGSWKLAPSDLFYPPKAFLEADKKYSEQAAAWDRKVKAYLKTAQPLLTSAELNSRLNAEEVAAQLEAAAKSAGLIE